MPILDCLDCRNLHKGVFGQELWVVVTEIAFSGRQNTIVWVVTNKKCQYLDSGTNFCNQKRRFHFLLYYLHIWSKYLRFWSKCRPELLIFWSENQQFSLPKPYAYSNDFNVMVLNGCQKLLEDVRSCQNYIIRYQGSRNRFLTPSLGR